MASKGVVKEVFRAGLLGAVVPPPGLLEARGLPG